MTRIINSGTQFISASGIDKSKVTTLFGQLRPITNTGLKESLGMENPLAIVEINDSAGNAKTYFIESDALVNSTNPQADAKGKFQVGYFEVFEEASCSIKKRHLEYHTMPIKEAREFREFMPTYTEIHQY